MRAIPVALSEKNARLNEIADMARSLWDDFSDLNQLNPEDIFMKREYVEDRVDQVVEFYKFCSAIYAPQLGGNSVEPSISTANLMEGASEPVQSVSWLLWLTDSSNSECPIILLDLGYLNKRLPYADAERKKLELILHETGHLVLHKNDLKNGGPGLAMPAYPEMEAEAWWFCYSIIGYCIASCAYETRAANDSNGNFDDEGWKCNWPWYL